MHDYYCKLVRSRATHSFQAAIWASHGHHSHYRPFKIKERDKSTMPSAIVVNTWFCPTVYVDKIVVRRVVVCDRSQKLDLEQDLSQIAASGAVSEACSQSNLHAQSGETEMHAELQQ